MRTHRGAVSPRIRNRENVAFFKLNAVISMVFLVVVVAEVVFKGGFRLR